MVGTHHLYEREAIKLQQHSTHEMDESGTLDYP